MRVGAVQQYDWRVEILPALAVGILLNVIGWFVRSKLVGIVPGAGEVFIDMIGTAYCAIVIGPWWAATVGVVTNAISGNFSDNYFPFGLVNAFGALVWGYVAIAANVRAEMTERRPTLREFVFIYLLLWIVGALVCGLTSTLVKLVLYPPESWHYLAGKTYDRLASIAPGGLADLWHGAVVLAAADVERDLIDKSIVVAFALMCAIAHRSAPLQIAKRGERLRVDAISVFAFSFVYGLYLFAARITRPVISIEIPGRCLPFEVHVPGQCPLMIHWLETGRVIALLYVPLALALIVFLLASYDWDRPYGRLVNARRLMRRGLYDRLAPRLTWKSAYSELDLRVAQGKQVYTLVGGVAFWPLARTSDITGVSAGYLFALSAAIGYYFYQTSALVERYTGATDSLSLLHRWTEEERLPESVAICARIVQSIGAGLGAIQGNPRESGALVYAVMSTDARGIAPAGADKRPRAREVLLVAIVAEEKIFGTVCRDRIDQIIASSPVDGVYVICLNARGGENADWIKVLAQRGIKVGLLGWDDLAGWFEKGGTQMDLCDSLSRSEVRTLDLTLADPAATPQQTAGKYDEEAARTLAKRSLPGLQYVIDHLPQNSVVFDLGCGRGRHTLYALLAGHSVVASDRNKDALTDLRGYADAIPQIEQNVVICEGDYLDLKQEAYDSPELVIVTGVLQHVSSIDELTHRLGFFRSLVDNPNDFLYIEMLFDMRFDGHPAADGRAEIKRAEFEKCLRDVFAADRWSLRRVAGPVHRRQDFSGGPRSFYPTGRSVECDSIEYLLVRAIQ